MREQFDFEGTDEQAMEFVRYLVGIAEKAHTEILDCSVSWSRQLSDKPFDEIVEMIKGSHVSIQVNKDSYFKMRDYEKWEGGYIEGCLRTMTTPDYFIWTYHKMSELDNILNYINNGSTKRNYN